ncbi:MAG: aldehyde dehydrogenase family protein [Myxococcota bacterium]
MKIRNPATLSVLEEVATDDAASVAKKYARAWAAQPAWAATALSRRLACLREFRDAVARERDGLALILTREMGKPVTQARNELNALAGRIDFFLEHTEKVLTPEVVLEERDGGALKLEESIVFEPLGVIANVSAWNYPWFVGSNVFVPALLTGNSVLYKPSEHATLTGLAIERLLHASGVPKDAFIAVIGPGDVGQALLSQPINGVFFTGSYRTGKKIAEHVAARFVRLGLELGGKDPTYVCEDVDVRKAAESLADGAMYNTGQSCCSVERIYVHRAIADDFLREFVDVVKSFTIGDPEDDKTYIGPLAREEQLAELELQVQDALSKGARLLIGGKRIDRTGYYFEPTVLTDVSDDMRIMREESFGPIIGIGRVNDDAEAIRRMNDTEYGLTAGVYTRDQNRANAILSQLDAGSVYWNCCDRVSPRLPWTGRKHSGLGSTLSTHGIRSFLQPKAWHRRAP